MLPDESEHKTVADGETRERNASVHTHIGRQPGCQIHERIIRRGEETNKYIHVGPFRQSEKRFGDPPNTSDDMFCDTQSVFATITKNARQHQNAAELRASVCVETARKHPIVTCPCPLARAERR